MIVIEREVAVAATPERVFDYLADFTTTEEWDPGTVRTVLLQGDGGIGTTYRNTSRFSGRETELVYEVVDFVRPERIVLRGENSTVVAHDTMSFRTEAHITRVTLSRRVPAQRPGPLGRTLLPQAVRPARRGSRARSARRSGEAGRMSVLDTLLDRTVIPGYSKLGYRLRSRSWPDNDPALDALQGKTVVVTGARSGLGKATASGLAALGATVRLVVRDATKAEGAVADLRGEVPDATFVVDECDISDLDAVRRYAGRLVDPIHALIHNAGVMPPERTESPQGHELTLATHVLGPLLLTELLKPLLSNGRVIFVASGGMYTQQLPTDDPEYRHGSYRGATAYARSKRIQVALTPLLATHLAPDLRSHHAPRLVHHARPDHITPALHQTHRTAPPHPRRGSRHHHLANGNSPPPTNRHVLARPSDPPHPLPTKHPRNDRSPTSHVGLLPQGSRHPPTNHVTATKRVHNQGGPGAEPSGRGVGGRAPTKHNDRSKFAFPRTKIGRIGRAPGRIRTCAPASGGRCSIP